MSQKPITTAEMATGRVGQYAHITALGVTDATHFVQRLIDELEEARGLLDERA